MNLSGRIFLSLVLAILTGMMMGEAQLPFIKEWVAPIGMMFLDLIRIMIIPVVFTSLIVGMTNLGKMRKLVRISVVTLALYTCTTMIAILIGFGVAGIFRPGAGMVGETVIGMEKPAVVQTFLGMISTRPLQSMSQVDILPAIIFALLVSVGIIWRGQDKGKRLAVFFAACAEICYQIIGLIMKAAPFGVFALLLPVVVQNGTRWLLPLSSVLVSVSVGCVLHAVLIYSSLVSIAGRMNPVKFFRDMSEAMLIGFATASSSAALPINMKNTEEKLGVSRDIASFVLPLGAAINMDGTALYMGVCSLFVANVYGIDLTVQQMVAIVITGTLTSLGTTGIPGSGIIMLGAVLQSVGLPVEGLALLIGIDRVLDMFRTCLNITGDAAVAVVVNRLEQRQGDSGPLVRE